MSEAYEIVDGLRVWHLVECKDRGYGVRPGMSFDTFVPDCEALRRAAADPSLALVALSRDDWEELLAAMTNPHGDGWRDGYAVICESARRQIAGYPREEATDGE